LPVFSIDISNCNNYNNCTKLVLSKNRPIINKVATSALKKSILLQRFLPVSLRILFEFKQKLSEDYSNRSRHTSILTTKT
jgi:hypothetical protein